MVDNATFLRYSQTTGLMELIHRVDGVDGPSEAVATGWAGNGPGKNNPDMDSVIGVGPLPRGFYSVCEPSNNQHTGPYSIRLIPYEDNVMHGRSDFLIHGASKDPNKHGQESMGCIILDRQSRERVWGYRPYCLEVVK